LPSYQKVRPYDITDTIRQHSRDIDDIRRKSRGSEEYTYAVTWNGTGGGGSLGNGTLVGLYRRVGTGVIFRIQLTWGSTTSAPSSVWYFTLPVPPDCTQADYIGPSQAVDSSVPGWYPGACWITTDAGVNPDGRVYGHAPNVTGRIGGSIPFTWATGDIWRVGGTYTAFEDNIDVS
jgi:hypothetical protein